MKQQSANAAMRTFIIPIRPADLINVYLNLPNIYQLCNCNIVSQ